MPYRWPPPTKLFYCRITQLSLPVTDYQAHGSAHHKACSVVFFRLCWKGFSKDTSCDELVLAVMCMRFASSPHPCTNGFSIFSCPTLVSSPCPGSNLVSSGKANTCERMLVTRLSQFPPGRSVRPTDFRNMRSPQKQTPASAQ